MKSNDKQMNKPDIKNNKAEVKVQSIDAALCPSTKSLIDLGIWVFMMMTWFNISGLTGSTIIKDALPILIIFTGGLIIRTFRQPANNV